jgi:hypothetical protein
MAHFSRIDDEIGSGMVDHAPGRADRATIRKEGFRQSMFRKYRGLASILLAGQILLLPATALHAQDAPAAEETEIIGPRELRGFQLPAEPKAEAPAPQPDTPGPPTEPGDPATSNGVVAVDAPPPATTPSGEAGTDAEADAVAAAVENAMTRAGTTSADATATDPAGEPAADRAPIPPAARPADPAVPASSAEAGARPSLPDAPVTGGPASSAIDWSYVLAALVLAVLAFGAVRYLRRQGPVREEFAIVGQPHVPLPQAAARPPRPAPAPKVTPAPSPFQPMMRKAAPTGARSAPASGTVVGIQIRPWLQLEFTPERVAATPTEATVQYELVIRNTGNAVAKNVRLEGAMLNAGSNQDREIRSFFQRPIGEKSARVLAIPPRGTATLRNTLRMAREDMREITIEGRRLFIPMVAFNAVYEWGDGKSGQTSMSYLVGRETEKSSDKMAAFRLDLGPRVYRSLGKRESETAVLV